MKKIGTIWFCFICCFEVYAQIPEEKSLLWEISGNGLEKHSYIFGTIHLICNKDFVLSDSLRSKLALSELLALEIDMDDPQVMLTMYKSMNMQNGTLKSIMTEADYDKLARFYQDSIGVNLALFSKTKPVLLTGLLFKKILSCEPVSYEMSLIELAGKQQAEVVGLETVEEQMAVMDSIPYPDQIKSIVALVDSLPKARKEFQDMLQVYMAGDIEKLQTVMLQSEFEMEANQELLITKRNKKWIPKMMEFMTAKPTFFAVGAGHLGGYNGIISLLQQKGYSVVAVSQ